MILWARLLHYVTQLLPKWNPSCSLLLQWGFRPHQWHPSPLLLTYPLSLPSPFLFLWVGLIAQQAGQGWNVDSHGEGPCFLMLFCLFSLYVSVCPCSRVGLCFWPRYLAKIFPRALSRLYFFWSRGGDNFIHSLIISPQNETKPTHWTRHHSPPHFCFTAKKYFTTDVDYCIVGKELARK